MRARLLTILLVMLLALPVPAMLPPVQASTQLLEPPAPTLATKKKTKKGKPKFRTVRKTVTQTFTNPALIDVPNGDLNPVKADLYPSLIAVAGFANGTITDVDVILHGFTWNDPALSDAGFPEDADVLLAASHLGTNALVLSDVGGADPVTNLTLSLDDEAGSPLPSSSPLVSGTFQPTDNEDTPAVLRDTFPAPAPTLSETSALRTFDGGSPNGIWQLFVVDDDGSSDRGRLIGGWSLRITAEVEKRVKVKTKKKGKGRR